MPPDDGKRKFKVTVTDQQDVLVSNGRETARLSPAEGREFMLFLHLQRVQGFDPPTEPVFDDETNQLFRDRIARCTSYLEFGSGGSTVAVDKLGIPAISVECDPYFAAVVSKELRDDTKVQLLVVSIGLTTIWGRPVFRRVTPERLACWKRYSAAPFASIREQGSFPEFVLVDGRFRAACALRTAREAQLMKAPVAILMDDYYDGTRPSYRRVERVFGEPQRVGRSAFFEIPADAGLPIDQIDAILAVAVRDFE